jgi:hypothetical protein
MWRSGGATAPDEPLSSVVHQPADNETVVQAEPLSVEAARVKLGKRSLTPVTADWWAAATEMRSEQWGSMQPPVLLAAHWGKRAQT